MRASTRIFSALTIAGIACACSSHVQPKDPSAYSASFVLDEISVSSNTKSSSSTSSGSSGLTAKPSSWQLPALRTLGIKTCAKDRAYLNPVIGQDFVVSGGESESTVQTDGSGCFVWTENIPFDYVVPETYVTLDRTIAPRGGGGGHIDLKLAIDPWKDDNGAVKDLRYETIAAAVPEQQATATLTGEAIRAQALSNLGSDSAPAAKIVASTVQYSFDQVNYSANNAAIPLQITIAPKLFRQGLDGAMVSEDLLSGSFRLQYALVEKLPSSGASGDTKQVIAQDSQVTHVNQGLVVINSALNLAQIPSQQALFELHYRLDPINAPTGLSPEEGIVQITSLTGTGSGASIPPKAEEAFNLFVSSHKKALLTAAASAVKPAECGQSLSDPGFILDQVGIGDSKVSAVDSMNLSSEIKTEFKACILDPVQLKPIVNFPLEVSSSDEDGLSSLQTQGVMTDSQGCARWTETFKANQAAAEKWIPLVIKLQSTTAPYAGITRTLTINVNPWYQTGGQTWDCRSGAPPVNPLNGPAQLSLGSVTFQFVGRDLDLDRYMDLQLKRHYQLSFQPTLYKPQTGAGTAEFPLPDARFKIRVALLSDPADVATDSIQSKPVLAQSIGRFIGHDEAIANSHNGQIVQNIGLPFDFRELPLVASRNTLVIELSPADPSSPLQKIILQGPFQTLDDTGTIHLTPSTLNLDSLIQEGEARIATRAPTKSAYKLYREFGAMPRFTDSQLGKNKDSLGWPELEKLIQDPTSDNAAASKFCAVFLSENEPWLGKVSKKHESDYQKCLKDPTHSLNFKKFSFVESLLGPVKEDPAEPSPFSFSSSASFGRCHMTTDSVDKGHSTTSTVSAGVDLHMGAGVGTPGPKVVKADTGIAAHAGYQISHSWYTTYDLTDGKNHSDCLTLSDYHYVYVEPLGITVNARVRDCLQVGLGNSSGFVCDPSHSERIINETYYYVSQSNSYQSSPLRDSRELNDRAWTKVIRGQAEFETFHAAMEDKNSFYDVEPDLRSYTKQSDSWFSQAFGDIPLFSDDNFPGMIN